MGIFNFLFKNETKQTNSIKEISDFIVTRDETADMVSIDDMVNMKGSQVLNNFIKYYTYYTQDEILTIVHIICVTKRSDDLMEWLVRDNKMNNKIRKVIFDYMVKEHSAYEWGKFIKYCKLSKEEIDDICSMFSDLNEMNNIINELHKEKQYIPKIVANNIIKELLDYEKKLEKDNTLFKNSVVNSISYYVRGLMNTLNDVLTSDQRKVLMELLFRDIIVNRYFYGESNNISDPTKVVLNILKTNICDCVLNEIEREELLNYMINLSPNYCRIIYEDYEDYHIKDRKKLLFEKMVQHEAYTHKLFNDKKLYFSELTYIIETLVTFKNNEYRNICVDIISKSFRGEISKDERIKELFDSLMVMKKLCQ
jgi:hypothetical protein